MRVTHLGHACLLVEMADKRILVDPGTFAGDFESLKGLDAIAITHQHPDHADPERLPAAVANNPEAVVLAEPETADVLATATDGVVRPDRLSSEEPIWLGDVQLRPVGELHAVIHESLTRVGNRGLVISADGEPTLFHPGDSYDAEPGQVDVLAVPISAPWAKISATADFVNRIAPREVVPIHDALLSQNGRRLYLNLVSTFGPDGMELRDLSGGRPADFS